MSDTCCDPMALGGGRVGRDGVLGVDPDAITGYRAEWAGVRDRQDNVWRGPQQHHIAVKVQEVLLSR